VGSSSHCRWCMVLDLGKKNWSLEERSKMFLLTALSLFWIGKRGKLKRLSRCGEVVCQGRPQYNLFGD
jgi:hypothetical protein